ncbi:MAG: Flp family type IVb pilin [Desulfuromonadales bacterium]|nr:Flp family type IVb pilin [Desulfuromonadales bacterium]
MKWNINLQTLVADEEGATMVEYGIMIGFIATICVLAVSGFGRAVLSLFESALPPWGG